MRLVATASGEWGGLASWPVGSRVPLLRAGGPMPDVVKGWQCFAAAPFPERAVAREVDSRGETAQLRKTCSTVGMGTAGDAWRRIRRGRAKMV